MTGEMDVKMIVTYRPRYEAETSRVRSLGANFSTATPVSED